LLYLTIFLLCIFTLPSFAKSGKSDNTSSLYTEGINFLKAGFLDKAKSKFEAILEINPAYAPARSKIRLIQNKEARMLERDRIIAQKKSVLEVEKKWVSLTKAARPEKKAPITGEKKTKQQKIIKEKAQQIIPEINFTDAHLRDVLKYLSRISGVNIVLDEGLFVHNAGGELGIPINKQGKSREEGESETVEGKPALSGNYGTSISDRVTISLKNIPLVEALKYILLAKGMAYRIDDYAIVVSTAQRLQQVGMETRYYHLTSGIGNFTEYAEPSNKQEEGLGWEGANKKKQKTLTIKDVLEQSGVPFPKGSKIFLDERTGTLIVRNTRKNLKVIEDILSILDVIPCQVEIEARFVEIKEQTAKELGMEWMIKSSNYTFGRDNNLRLDDTTSDSAYGQYPLSANRTGKEGFTKGLRFIPNVNSNGTVVSPAGSIVSLSGILTEPQFRAVLHTLNQSGNVNLVSAPKITTLNNQRAKIEVGDELIYPGDYEITPPTVKGNTSDIITPGIAVPISFETRDLGVILNVVPNVGADKKTINLTLTPEISDLLEWMDYGIPGGTGWNKVPIKKPVIQLRDITTSVVVNNGDTVVLGGLIKEDLKKSKDKIPLLGDIPLLGRMFRSETKQSIKTNLIIFITAKLVAPSGAAAANGKKEYTY